MKPNGLETLRRTAAICGALLVCAAACGAATITVGLAAPVLSGPPGAVVTFNGSLAGDPIETVYLNSAGINLSGGFTPADENLDLFFSNAPLFINPGDTTPNISLFAVNIPSGLPQGAYQGVFTVLGGSDASSEDVVGTANFTVEVNATTAVPEPGTLALVGWAAAIWGSRIGRRRLRM